MQHNSLFQQCVSDIPENVRKQMDWSFAISDKIDSAMKAQSMSKEELASRMHTRPSTVAKWLRGDCHMSVATLALLSTILQTDMVMIP